MYIMKLYPVLWLSHILRMVVYRKLDDSRFDSASELSLYLFCALYENN